MNKKIRLNKSILEYSRREIDEIIKEGRIKVNSKIALLGQQIEIGDKIEIDNKEINWEKNIKNKNNIPNEKNFVYLKYWKPFGVTCTTSKKDETNIIDKGGFNSLSQRVFPIGRIDKDSTGLILLTSDTRLSKAFLEPKMKYKKIYQVQFKSPISDEQIEKLQKGVIIPSEIKRNNRVINSFESLTLPCELKRSLTNPNYSIEIALIEGRNRQIRLMSQSIGLEVRSLHRIEFGGININNLKHPGDWKYLNQNEMNIVKEAVQKLLEIDNNNNSDNKDNQDDNSDNKDSDSSNNI